MSTLTSYKCTYYFLNVYIYIYIYIYTYCYLNKLFSTTQHNTTQYNSYY